MLENSIRFLSKSLERGNFSHVSKAFDGKGLPDQSDLTQRIDSYFADRGGIEGIPPVLRKDITFILEELYSGMPPSSPDKAIVVGATEAIVVADGSRPVYFVRNDGLETKGEPNGPFVAAVDQSRAALERAALAVGRIETDDRPAPGDLDVYYDGTGFLVAQNLIMTNRHVMERMVRNPFTEGPFTLKYDYWINFDGQLGGGLGRRFAIEEVVYAGEGYIGDGGDFNRLDMALLRIGAPATPAAVQPAPISLSGTAPLKDQKVAVIGFPAAPLIYTGTGVPTANSELEDVLRKVFDMRFGYKRCAAGEVSGIPGSVPNDPKLWVAKHNAPTLGGNSGSPVLTLNGPDCAALALHFYGMPRTANYAYAFDRLEAILAPLGVPVSG